MDTATCIVGLAEDGKVWIGGDSASIHKDTLRLFTRKDEKVFIRTGPDNTSWIFGYTTSYRMGQLIRYVLELPALDDRNNIQSFMVKKFIPALQKCLSENGYQQKEKDQVKGGAFLVGLLGQLFAIQDDYQVGILAGGYMAVGCGDHLALGAMYATIGLEPDRRLIMALKAAEEFSAGVRGPFTILSI
jgi:hypothetical protein